MEEKKNKRKVTFLDMLKIIKKRVHLSTILLLAITLASSSYAWFIYATRISAGISAHIESWNIQFRANDNMIEERVTFEVPDLYPGMQTYTDSISAYNIGEKAADIYYEIESCTILGVNYRISSTLTSNSLVNKLANQYPFKITFDLSEETLQSSIGTTTFTIQVEWPYESGNDALDTYWGNEAYTFQANNPGSPSITLDVLIRAIQQPD